MKQDVHPDYHEITVAMTDGIEFKTRSTYGKAGDRLQLDIDIKTHPAWTGQHRLVDRGGQLAKFNKRFSAISSVKEDGTSVPVAVAAAPVEKIKLTTTVAKAAPKKKKA